MENYPVEYSGQPEGQMTIICAWHMRNFGYHKIMGTKDGDGVTGTTGGICDECEAIENEKLELAAMKEAEKFEADRQEKADMFRNAPWLHGLIMITGKTGVHYLEPPLRELYEAAKDEPEVKSKWN